MSDLRGALDDYLVVRRSLGYQLDKAEELLTSFVATWKARAPPTSPPSSRSPGRRVRPGLIRPGGAIGWERCEGSPATSNATTLEPRFLPPTSCPPPSPG